MVAEWISCLEKRPADRTGEDLDIVHAKLKELRVFDRFHTMVLHQLCFYAYYQDLEERITLFRQGDIGCYWYAVLSGTLDVYVSSSGKFEGIKYSYAEKKKKFSFHLDTSTKYIFDAEVICSLGPGKVFGESVLDDTPRQATVITSEFCELLLVEKRHFRVIWERSKSYLEHLIATTSSLKLYSGIKEKKKENTEGNSLDNDNSTTCPFKDLSEAGMVLRHRMKQSSKLICKRKLGNQVLKRCFVGSEAIDWLRKISPLVHGRFHAIAMLQALLEEGVITHVDGSECEFKDKDILYQFSVDEKEEGEKPGDEEYTEEDLDDALLMLSRSGPDAQLRLALRKSCSERNSDDLALIYEELVHIKALQHLSTMVKKELAAAIVFEAHREKGIVVFNEGEEGKSWYIILKGAVNVVVHGKGVVCQLNEGDEFGKLALVNNALRTATIETAQDICHFLKIGKLDFNRIFRDVETNTVRLKEHTQEVLVLEKMNIRPIFGQNGDSNPQKYSVMAGTPIKMVEYLLETRIDKTCSFDDHFLNDFLVTFPIFMTTEVLCSELLSKTNFLNCGQDISRTSIHDHSEAIKKRVVQLTERWCCFAGNLFLEDKNICSFVKDLLSFLEKDKLNNEFNSLRAAILTLHERFPSVENTADGLPTSQKNRLHARRMGVVDITMKTEEYKPIRGSDQNIFRVFCADHTYTTLALPYKATAQTIVDAAEERVLLGNDCVLCEVKSSGERIPLEPNEICVSTGLSVNGRLFMAPREHLDSLTPTPDQEGPVCSSLAFLETVGSKELAFFISQYDYELFNAVNIYEFIYHMYGKENYNQITANLDLLLQRFNEVQFWVETQVLLTQQLNKRVYLLKKFIKMAAHCKEYNNWYSFFAIVMGLNSVAVSRLTQTWEKLPGKFRKILEEFESTLNGLLKLLTGFQSGDRFINLNRPFAEYGRAHGAVQEPSCLQTFRKLKPPILPFMPLLMKDMTFTNEGNKTQFDELVNFEKMRMISSTLRLIQYCRSEPFAAYPPASSIKVIQEITIFVRNLQVIDNQRTLTQLSHRLEPRKT